MPSRAVEMKSEGKGRARKLVCRLDTDDLVMAGPDHPLSFGRDPDRPDPRLHVRGVIGNGLDARIDRALYYEIVEMALADGGDPPAIWTDGARFPLVDCCCCWPSSASRPIICYTIRQRSKHICWTSPTCCAWWRC